MPPAPATPTPKFGIFAPQVGLSYDVLRQRARLADQLGYDSFWLVDHMWARGLPDHDHLEAWTVMAALAEATERIRIGSLVLCNAYRNPALLAKMAASLDQLSHGRLILGLGSGWMEEEFVAYGYPFPSPRIRLEQLDEALTLIKHMLTETRTSFAGKYYSIQDAVNLPRPVQRPHPPILIGGAGERHLLRVVAQHADIWNCPNHSSRNLEHKLEILRRHCDAVGRDFASLQISEQCIVVVGSDETDLHHKLEQARARLGKTFDIEAAGLIGTPPQLADAIRQRQCRGVELFTLLFGDRNQPESLQLFAEEVIPLLS